MGIVEHIAVDEEQQRHVNFLSGEQFLLLEAETFDLAKVRRNLFTNIRTALAFSKVRNVPGQV